MQVAAFTCSILMQSAVSPRLAYQGNGTASWPTSRRLMAPLLNPRIQLIASAPKSMPLSRPRSNHEHISKAAALHTRPMAHSLHSLGRHDERRVSQVRDRKSTRLNSSH